MHPFHFFVISLLVLFLASACAPTPASSEATVVHTEHHSSVPDSSAHDHSTNHEGNHLVETVSVKARTDLTCTDDALLCVGLVTASGMIDDNGINQRAWEGVQRAETDLIAKIEYVETGNPSEMLENVEYFAQQDFDVIVTVGQEMVQVTMAMAAAYPRIHFIGVNQTGFEETENASDLEFSATKIGYAAGALAAKTSNSGVVGIVLSSQSNQVAEDLRLGFESGVTAFPQDIEVIALFHPEGNHSSAHDAEWGQQAAAELLEAGADVIFAEESMTGFSALAAAAQSERTYCIGIGADLWSQVPEAQPCLISSIKRHIDDGIFETIAKVAVSQTDYHSHHAELFNGRIEYVFYSLFDDVVAPYDKNILQTIAKKLGNQSVQITDLHIHTADLADNDEGEHVHVHEDE